jgi:CRISPR/Cas system CSM-associated protein Csm3 (group 7 of RAMP superfamily)
MCPHYFLNKANEPKADYCIICQSFGSPWKAGQLHFSDLVWNPPEDWDTTAWRQIRKTQVRPGVSILRSRWIKVEEKLFFMETSLPGVESVFEGSISGEVESKQHFALLIAGIKNLSMVGGAKSRGLGWLLSSREEPIFELVQTDEELLTEAELMEELRLWNSSQSPS